LPKTGFFNVSDWAKGQPEVSQSYAAFLQELSMIARFFGTAFMLLTLPGRMAQTLYVPADEPVPGASAERYVSATNQANDPSQKVGTQGARTPDAKRPPRKDDQTQRARELIYFFRTYRVFCRDEEWAQTIRELATIGKDAVPELVAELDRTDRDATLRSLAFCLRAIGDPRAVPALIRAIPKALRPPGSDCGVNVADPALRMFMKAHQDYKDDHANSVACGRPVNEILSALERITKHREPPDVADNDLLRHVFLEGTPAQQAQQRALFEQRQNLWQAWWSEHWQEFVTQEELHSVELAKRHEDLVEMAGVARSGALFPTGASVRLGPIRMLRLTQSAYWNGKSHLDFDTGRIFTLYEGINSTDWGERSEFGSRVSTWYRRNGIDVHCQGPVGGVDLQLWLIDDSRWDTLEAEIRKDEPLQLGREATDTLARFENTWTDFDYDELATFLFTTREGGRGIVQVFPKDKDADRYRVRYRMWLNAQAKPTALPRVAQLVAEPRRAKSPGTLFGRIVTTTLELPAVGRECFLNLKTGRKAVPPEFVNPNEIATAASLPRNEQFTQWRRDQGIDVFGYMVPSGPVPAAPAKAEAAELESQLSLIGIDLIEARIVPQTFDELTVEEAREILERMPENKSGISWMMIDHQLTERPDTFAFKTREGAVGLLQIEAAEKEAGKLTIRYRLERRD
jgi:hypothetical protein